MSRGEPRLGGKYVGVQVLFLNSRREAMGRSSVKEVSKDDDEEGGREDRKGAEAYQ